MTLASLRVRVTGRVQGVAYRAWTRDAALARGLAGWVRNRADGSVEALLEGPEDAVRAMVGAMRDGPRLAAVREVKTREVPGEGAAGFEIRR